MARERDEAKRSQFREQIAGKDPKTLKFLDESGFHRSLCRSYGWSPRGKPCVGRPPGNRGKNQSLIAVLGREGILAWDIQSGSVKADTIQTFIQDKLAAHLKAGDILVVDNAAAHRRSMLKPLLDSLGCQLIYLPPYSPDLNPIELVWRPVKARVRSVEPDNWPELHQVMGEAMVQVDPTKARQFFEHCGYREQENKQQNRNGPTSN